MLVLALLLLSVPTSTALLDDILDWESFGQQEDSDFVTPCVLKLIEKYFKSERAIKGSLAIVGQTTQPGTIENAVVKILNEDESHKLGVMVKDGRKFHFSPAHVTEKASNYFFLLSHFDELLPNIKLFHRLPTFNPLANVVVLFTSPANDSFVTSESQKIFEELARFSMYNVNILAQKNGSSAVQSFTYFPYEGSNCATSVQNVRLIEECFNLKAEASDEDEIRIESHFRHLFPKIPHRFHACKLNVSAFPQAPYAVEEQGRIVRGLEILMLRQIAKELDFTLAYEILEPRIVNSNITANATDGVYANILQGISDIMVGGFHENSVSRKILSSSIPFYQDDLTWCVPPAGLASSLTNAFGIFNLWTWLLTLSILLLTGIIILAYSRQEEHQNAENFIWSVLMSLSLGLGNPTHYFPNRLVTQTFLLFVLFYGTHFNVVYHSFLITVMTRPKYEPQIENAEMAVEEGFVFYGNEDTLEYFKRKENDKISKAIVNSFQVCYDLDECLSHLKTDLTRAVAVSRNHADNNPAIPRSEIFCFLKKDNIYTFSIAMLTKSSTHLLEKINSLVRTISESGLLQKWEQESSAKVTGDDHEKAGPHGNAIKLKVEHVQGGFLLLGVGFSVAAVTFVLEWVFFGLQRRFPRVLWLVRFDRLVC